MDERIDLLSYLIIVAMAVALSIGFGLLVALSLQGGY